MWSIQTTKSINVVEIIPAWCEENVHFWHVIGRSHCTLES